MSSFVAHRSLAVGLFQLDGLTMPEAMGQHRYCTQVVLPMLDALARREHMRLTVAATGVALEFLAEHYPGALDLMRRLQSEGRLEIAASLAGPQLWVSFPGRDLQKGAQVNDAILGRLGMGSSRLFVGSHGLFGPGLEALQSRFDLFFCKDTYFRAYAAGPPPAPLYRMGNARVVVGANHLLADMAIAEIRTAAEGGAGRLPAEGREYVDRALRASVQSSFGLVDGEAGDLRWHWYHTGGAHHLVTRASPLDWEGFFFDPEWAALAIGHLDRLAAEGWRMVTISEYAAEVGRSLEGALKPFPALPEGGWDSRATQGVYGWMGRQRGSPQAVGALAARGAMASFFRAG